MTELETRIQKLESEVKSLIEAHGYMLKTIGPILKDWETREARKGKLNVVPIKGGALPEGG